MNIIVCLDDGLGLLFNNRRQSQDRIVRQDILNLPGAQKIFMNAYSGKLFADMEADRVVILEDFLEQADREYCFVENRPVAPFLEKIEQIIVYFWNRSYPSDFKFDVDLSGWQLLSETQFSGSSHPEITRRTYRREVNA